MERGTATPDVSNLTFAQQRATLSIRQDAVMTMQIAERRVGTVTILDLSGTLTIDHGVETLQDRIRSLVVEGRTRVVLNLALLSYMDSSGLGQLIASHNLLSKASGGLTLLNLSRRTRELLSITRLTSVFHLTDSEDEALRDFGDKPSTSQCA